jgi:hypothetical protein
VPPDLGRGAEQVRVALELPVPAAEHVPGEDDARVGRAHHLADVLVRVGHAADDHELHPAGPVAVDPRERLDQLVRVVLGLEPADEQQVAPGLQPEALERLRATVAGSSTP